MRPIWNEMRAFKPCGSERRGIECSRRQGHFGLHRGRAKVGGSHMQWTDAPQRRHKRRKPGPSRTARRQAKERRAAKLARRGAT